jgi:EF hand
MTMKKINLLKVTTLVLAATLGIGIMSAQAEDNYTSENIATNNDWQTPLAAEFSKLDTSGNGLVLPNEASKNKAFNKKTFAAADTDNDGTIDQSEYIQYKSITTQNDVN